MIIILIFIIFIQLNNWNLNKIVDLCKAAKELNIKTQDLNERFLLAFYIDNILIINDMKSEGFKVKFMFSFLGLFVEVHSIFAANNDTMEGSQENLPFIILLIVAICVISFLSYYMYRMKKENIANEEKLAAKNSELLRSVDVLSMKNREIQQMLVNKIRETDNWNRDKEAERENLKKRLEEMEKLHNSFFTETIHEMRTPLSLVLGSLSELLQRKNDIDSSEATQLLSAYRNTLALQDLIEQLRNTRHGDDVANHLRIARYDMISITKQICDLFVDWIAMNNVEFHINTLTPVLWVWIDRRKMEFALRVLLSNALKNTYRFGKITINLSVVRVKGKAFCSFSIQDDGLGESESTRLGLKQIADMTENSGAIFEDYSSKDETGTQYTILIPLGRSHFMERSVEFIEPDGDLVKLNEMQKEEIAELIQVVPKKKETGKKMLVIDDSDQIRWFLRHVFASEYHVLEAHNGLEGVDIAKTERPDIILCDVMMPIKDGLATCREIKAFPDLIQVPVVLLTAKVESEDVIAGIECGADDYITKPFDVEVLRSKINSLLKRREEMKRFYAGSGNTVAEGEVASKKDDSPSNLFMESVISTIEKHLDDPSFEAKVLADSLNMSLPTLYRKIKLHSDSSILELTRSVRLKKAAELISMQRYSIQEVSEMVGFNDTATFRKRFTEQYGVTPSQYVPGKA